MNLQKYKWALFSFKGRMRRKEYWLYSIPVLLLLLPTMFYQGGNTVLDALSLLISLLTIYASTALNAKRLQDRDRAIYWLILTLIPVIGPIYALVDLGILDGTKGRNRFGPDPKARQNLNNNGDEAQNSGIFYG
ncbi:MAG: DUF805 domain-containing protein [Enterovibrio sp.]